MGLLPQQVQGMSPAEFNACSKGYTLRMEWGEKLQWETTRWLAAMCMTPHYTKPLKPRELMQFPWEEDIKQQPTGIDWEDIKKRLKDVPDEIEIRHKRI